jgi:protein gp37
VSDTSNIEWTDASWNCLAGCEAVSPGCANCYAATMTRRLEAMGQADYTGLTTKKHFNGTVRCLPDKLSIPLKWKKPRRVFVNSMSDLFHEDVPDEFIDRVFATMSLTPQHTYQVLTKRAERMYKYIYGWPKGMSRGHHIALRRNKDGTALATIPPTHSPTGSFEDGTGPTVKLPLPNVWLGVSAEDQQRADERIPWLLKTPAAVRFVSAEPLLGPLDISPWLRASCSAHPKSDGYKCCAGNAPRYAPLTWVIVGGESGPKARPMHPAWVRQIRDQCQQAGVPFFFKQWGAYSYHEGIAGPVENTIRWEPPIPASAFSGNRLLHWDSENCQFQRPASDATVADVMGVGSVLAAKVGKHDSGRLLDEMEWSEFPDAHA